MNRLIKFAVPALALGMFALVPNVVVHADDAPPATQPAKATGSATFKVVDGTGKAVSGATVDIVTPPAPGAAAGGGGRANRPKPIAEGTTDENGLVTLKDVPVGDYAATGRLKGSGMGRVAKVTIATDTPADAAPITITLKARAAGGAGNGN